MKNLTKFFGASFQTSKKFQDPTFSIKIMVKPLENHVYPILPGKLVAFFPRPPGKNSSWLFPNLATRYYANHAMFMQNSAMCMNSFVSSCP